MKGYEKPWLYGNFFCLHHYLGRFSHDHIPSRTKRYIHKYWCNAAATWYVYCVHTPCIKSWGNNNRFLKAVRYGYGAEISHSHSISDVVLPNELSWVEPIWVKLSQIGPDWARLSRVEPSWAELSQVELLFLLLILHWCCVMPYTILPYSRNWDNGFFV